MIANAEGSRRLFCYADFAKSVATRKFLVSLHTSASSLTPSPINACNATPNYKAVRDVSAALLPLEALPQTMVNSLDFTPKAGPAQGVPRA